MMIPCRQGVGNSPTDGGNSPISGGNSPTGGGDLQDGY